MIHQQRLSIRLRAGGGQGRACVFQSPLRDIATSDPTWGGQHSGGCCRQFGRHGSPACPNLGTGISIPRELIIYTGLWRWVHRKGADFHTSVRIPNVGIVTGGRKLGSEEPSMVHPKMESQVPVEGQCDTELRTLLRRGKGWWHRGKQFIFSCIFIYFYFVCICMYICMSVCTCVCLHEEAGDQSLMSSLIILHLIYLDKVSHWTWSSSLD